MFLGPLEKNSNPSLHNPWIEDIRQISNIASVNLDNECCYVIIVYEYDEKKIRETVNGKKTWS